MRYNVSVQDKVHSKHFVQRDESDYLVVTSQELNEKMFPHKRGGGYLDDLTGFLSIIPLILVLAGPALLPIYLINNFADNGRYTDPILIMGNLPETIVWQAWIVSLIGLVLYAMAPISRAREIGLIWPVAALVNVSAAVFYLSVIVIAVLSIMSLFLIGLPLVLVASSLLAGMGDGSEFADGTLAVIFMAVAPLPFAAVLLGIFNNE